MNARRIALLLLVPALGGCALFRDNPTYQAAWYLVDVDQKPPHVFVAVLNTSMGTQRIKGVSLNPSGKTSDTGWQKKYDPAKPLSSGELLVIAIHEDRSLAPPKETPAKAWQRCQVPIRMFVADDVSDASPVIVVGGTPSLLPLAWESCPIEGQKVAAPTPAQPKSEQ